MVQRCDTVNKKYVMLAVIVSVGFLLFSTTGVCKNLTGELKEKNQTVQNLESEINELNSTIQDLNFSKRMLQNRLDMYSHIIDNQTDMLNKTRQAYLTQKGNTRKLLTLSRILMIGILALAVILIALTYKCSGGNEIEDNGQD